MSISLTDILYPSVFQGTQLTTYGTVKKVLQLDGESYQAVLWVNVGPYDIAWGYADEHEGEYVVIRGETTSTALMENDTLLIYGRYEGIESVEFDGTSYMLPVINVHRSFYSNNAHFAVQAAEKFDYPFVKQVAEAVFGKNIEIREPVAGEDMSEETAMIYLNLLGEIPYYLVELENQSNANFVKFLFGTYSGQIIDAKGPFDSGIERNIEFSADFEHFFLFTYNTNLETLTLAYYDKDFQKIWSREFMETVTAHYDFTKNNIYLVANNELYMINIETGEDTFPPTYIGERLEIRKLSDGIICISENKADAVMKIDINGNMVWKTNLSANIYSVDGIQIVEDRIVLQMSLEDGTHYVVLDSSTGEILQDAISLS